MSSHRVSSWSNISALVREVEWSRITAPVLMLIAERGFVNMRFGKEPEEYQRRLGCFADLRVETVAEAGHNLQHDQPERVAELLESFLTR